jgi:murein DD-endopeptidase MepM/ murein hydrolase activator NlpD
MRLGLALLLLLLFGGESSAAGLSVAPEVIAAGGAALLRWEGETPAVAVGRFNGQSFYLTPGADEATAVLGVDLEAEPGDYPVVVAVTDRRGRTVIAEVTLRVNSIQRPEERLTLPPEMVTPQKPAILRRIGEESRRLAAIFAGTRPEFLPEAFSLPVADPLGSPFGVRRILNGEPKSPHGGVDFRSPRGTSVLAPATAQVAFVGDLYYTGRTVVLDHGEGLFSYYAHLEKILCQPGERLSRGAVLGRVGSSGRSTGPHLHWGVKLREARLDPLSLVELPFGEKP